MEILGEDGTLLGEKTFEDARDDCQELVRTVALAVSLAIDVEDAPAMAPEPAPEESSSPRAPVELAPPEIEPAKEVTPAPVSSPAPKPRLRFEASALVRGTVGIARGFGMGVGIGAGLRRGLWSLALEGRYDVPSSSDLSPRGGLAIGLLGGALVPCLSYRVFFGCLPVTLGRLAVSTSGVEHPGEDSALFWAFGARVGAELPVLPALAFRISLDFLVVPERHPVLLGTAEVWRTSPVAGSLNAGVVVTF